MHSWGLTDPGCVRTQNQDSYQIEELDRNTKLFVVCAWAAPNPAT